MDFTKNTNLSIEKISENKTSGNELSVTKISDSTAEKTFTNNASFHFVTDTLTILWEPADSGCRLLRCFGNSPILNVPDMIDGRTVSEMGAYCFSRSRPRFPEKIYKTIFIDWKADRLLTRKILIFQLLEQSLMVPFLKKSLFLTVQQHFTMPHFITAVN